jgi:hypothetical protein
MRLSHITELAINHLFGRLLHRAIGAALLALFTLVAGYHFTVAGMLALEAEYGLLHARLIVAGAYAAAALIALIALWMTRTKPLIQDQPTSAEVPLRHMQIAMLVEAVMLGYTLARKSGDRIHARPSA